MFVGLHARFGEHRNVTFKDHTYMGFLDSLRMVAHIYTWVCMAVRVGWPEGMPVLKGRMLMWIEVRSAVMAGQHQACYCARQPVHRDESKDSNAARFYCKYKYVIEIDESHLNRAKPGSLTRINYGSW